MPRVIHFEIHADDPERAIRFYSALVGWTFQRWNETQDYWSIITGPGDTPGINGGLVRRPVPVAGQAVNAFVCTVQVDDLDRTLERALAQGGSLAVPKMAIPGIGWLAYFKDTEENVVGLMEEDPAARLPEDTSTTQG